MIWMISSSLAYLSFHIVHCDVQVFSLNLNICTSMQPSNCSSWSDALMLSIHFGDLKGKDWSHCDPTNGIRSELLLAMEISSSSVFSILQSLSIRMTSIRCNEINSFILSRIYSLWCSIIYAFSSHLVLDSCYHVLPTSTLATARSLWLPGCSSAESCRVSAHKHANQWQTNPKTWSGSQKPVKSSNCHSFESFWKNDIYIIYIYQNDRTNAVMQLRMYCTGVFKFKRKPKSICTGTFQPTRGQQEADQRNLLVWKCQWNLQFVNDPDRQRHQSIEIEECLVEIWQTFGISVIPCLHVQNWLSIWILVTFDVYSPKYRSTIK